MHAYRAQAAEWNDQEGSYVPSRASSSRVRPVQPHEAVELIWPAGTSASDESSSLLSVRMTDARELASLARSGIDRLGRYQAPTVVLGGELHMCFDELETLRTTLACVSLLAGKEPSIAAAVHELDARVAAPLGPRYPASALLELAQQLRGLLSSRMPRWLGYLDASVRQSLVRARSYQRRALLGGLWLRCSLVVDGADGAIAAYLPDASLTWLPAVTSLRARVLAEVHPRQEEIDPSALALRVLAFGRVVTLPAGL